MSVRVPILAIAVVTLLLGVWAGTARLVTLPQPPLSAVAYHGALIVFGFFGPLTSMERAHAARARWAWLSPPLGLAGTVLLVGGDAGAAAIVWTMAAVIGVGAAVRLNMLRRTPANLLFGAGSGAAATGAILWLAGRPTLILAAWWSLFLVLVIAGERMQFARIDNDRMRMATTRLLAAAGVAILGAVIAAVGNAAAGLPVFGIGLLGTAGALAWDDMRHRRPRARLPRFVAAGLRFAYGWLAVGGILWTAVPGQHMDAAIHAVLIGCVLTMVFVHAPMIFPGITGVRIPFHDVFWAHLGLLQVAMVVRVAGGLAEVGWLLRAGSIGTSLAVVAFFAATATSALHARTERRATA